MNYIKKLKNILKKLLRTRNGVINLYIPDYSQIHYNEVILWLEQQWGRQLSDHEKNILIQGYRFGRLKEMENNK